MENNQKRVQIGKNRWYPCPLCKDMHPSVTTLLDVIANPALGFWLQKNGTQKLYHFSKTVENYADPEEFNKWCKEAENAWEKAEGTAFWKSGKQTGAEAADYGSTSHAAIESHLHGKDIDLKSLPEPCQKSVKSYLEWEKDHSVKVIETEKIFYGCKFNVAGTADFVGEIDGVLTLMDHKTSASIYSSYIIQAWIYALCDEATSNRLYQQVAIGRWGKDGVGEFKIYKRNDFPGIEDARKVLLACGDIFKIQRDWDRLFPYVKKDKK